MPENLKLRPSSLGCYPLSEKLCYVTVDLLFNIPPIGLNGLCV